VSSKFYSQESLPPGLLITAKGYPDLSTREFLSLLTSPLDHRHDLQNMIPVFCLVDLDPYGMEIYGVYKYGGIRKSVLERERVALPQLQFLGIQFEDFRGGGEEGLLALGGRDLRKIEILLQREWVQKEPCVRYPPPRFFPPL
jgi:DNA topoisomerase VI subunit A